MTSSKTPFGFHDIDRKYLETLYSADNRVPYSDYEDYGRARKFYCGPVMNQNGVDYYVPVSHQLEKDMYIPGSKQNGFSEYYGVFIKDDKGNKTGCLDFRFMVPCVDDRFISPHDITGHAADEINFCRTYETAIKKQARDTYENIKSGEYSFLNKSSVDDEAVLDASWCYLDELDAKEKAAEKEKAAQEQAAKEQAVKDMQNKSSQRLLRANSSLPQVSDISTEISDIKEK